jgi:hypothetical protein
MLNNLVLPNHLDTVFLVLFAAVVVGFIWYEASFKRVYVGLNIGMSRAIRHGVVWLRQPFKGEAKISFAVDIPDYLEDPSWRTIKDMFKQFEKLGLDVIFIEIMVGDVVRTYSPDQRRPIIVNPART